VDCRDLTVEVLDWYATPRDEGRGTYGRKRCVSQTIWRGLEEIESVGSEGHFTGHRIAEYCLHCL